MERRTKWRMKGCAVRDTQTLTVVECLVKVTCDGRIVMRPVLMSIH